MLVYKFGGASVKDAHSVKNVISILQENKTNKLVVIISAMGKTTNHLEQVVAEYVAKNDQWKSTLAAIQQKHELIIDELFVSNKDTVKLAVESIIADGEFFLVHNKSTNFNFIYDQIVSMGEYLSTLIVSHFANECNLKNNWLDAKKCILTDHAYTEGKIDWKKTEAAIQTQIPILTESGFVITQGFIGSTTESFTTTLGREGSDYTAAIFSYCLKASKMVVWKDVEGILNADPKEFSDAQLIPELSYNEAIEMTYYGASVIHPKTIKPLQNGKIPMEVRSFLNYKKAGSLIAETASDGKLPPIIILKRSQVLLSFSAKDFSFIAEEHLSKVFAVLAENRLGINMMQNAAISFSMVVEEKPEKIQQVIETLQADFTILKNEHLTILTIRHYDQTIVDKFTDGKEILLRQISRNTLQVLMRE